MPNSLTITEERIAQISDIATSYVQKDKSLLDYFMHSYYHSLHHETADTISDADLAGMALHHFTLLKAYDGSKPQLAILNPIAEEQHFHSSHTVIQMVAYDRPFLVDTLLMTLELQGIDVHRTYNTIISVQRDDEGNITQMDSAQETGTAHMSLIHCEIAYQDHDELAVLQQILLDKIDTLDTVVGDWEQMQVRLTDIKAELSQKPLPEVFYSKKEIQAFLDWISDEHFIFLGFREYRLEGNNIEDDKEKGADLNLFAIGNSGLGLLRGATEDTLSKSFDELPVNLKKLLTEPRVLVLSKSSRVSPIHRPVYMDFLGIHKFDDKGKLVGEYRFIGLLTSQAYQLSVQQIPLLREKANKIMTMADLPRNGHAYHKMMHVINTLPRDDLFQASVEELYPIVSGITQLQDKKSLRLFTRIDHYQRFVSCLIYIPRDKFNTELRIKVQNVLKEAYGGTSSGFTTEFNESDHARVHVHVRTVPGQVNTVDTSDLESELSALMQSWNDHYQKMLLDNVGEQQANALIRRFLHYIPAAYQERFDARTAVEDTKRLADLTDEQPMLWHLYQSTGDAGNQLHLKLYGRQQPVILSKVLPVLENFGVSVISAQTYEFDLPEQPIWMQEYELTLEHVDTVDMQVVRVQFEDSLKQIWAGQVESDSFNELILTTKLDTYEVVVLRALSNYMRQARAPFSSSYIQQTVVKNSSISVALADLFDARMNPKHSDDDRLNKTTKIQEQITTALTAVDSLDEDRILRWYLDLINAMVRTNFYQTDNEGQRKDRLSFKFLAGDIPNLPKPKLMFEIFVYSPRVEAVHMRGGKAARGGLRWSDRMEDFRTEVLGLVKAQMVKNAVIVPVGSKGGFIVKTKTMADGREAFQAEGIACYQTFLRGMLDVTDNIVDGKIVPPANEIISTYLTNSVVNRLGIEALFRLYEETDQSLATIIRAYAITREVFEVSAVWKLLESLDNKVDAKRLLQLELRLRDALERGVVWFINAFGPNIQVADMISRFGSSVEQLTKNGGFIEQQFAEHLQEDTASLTQDGLSDNDATLFAMLPYHVDALDAALLAEQYERPVDEIAALYFEAYQVLQLDWMMDNIATLPQQDYWDRRARHALANEITRSLRLLMDAVLSKADTKQAFNDWKSRNEAPLESVTSEMQKLDNNDDRVISLSTLSVLMSELSGLVTK
ncbi:NAD-glutamate dehydrogenase domain-containing protein [Psychrobacter sp. CAL346-MNA-CIBAN-0220]|uniref:NAD-glutamate dehydrogenase domain-containing protein n=1 Tax=Psychrobacter sp. CAL346-MNA-CIBAN-0220 TaxID=3140457 RepID=UPI00331FE0D0